MKLCQILLHVECRTSVGVVVFLSCAISAHSCFCPPLLLAGCCAVSFSAAYVQLFCFWCWPLAISVGYFCCEQLAVCKLTHQLRCSALRRVLRTEPRWREIVNFPGGTLRKTNGGRKGSTKREFKGNHMGKYEKTWEQMGKYEKN